MLQEINICVGIFEKKNNMKNRINTVSLVLIASVSITAMSFTESTNFKQPSSKVVTIAAPEFSTLEKNKNTVVIDVRTDSETAQGVIEGVDMYFDYNSPSFSSDIAKLDKSKNYILYCRSGARSSAAAQVFVNSGFKKVYNLAGGIMNWKGKIVKK